jgi:hypothetical protein
MNRLQLPVQFDRSLSASAQLADHVIRPDDAVPSTGGDISRRLLRDGDYYYAPAGDERLSVPADLPSDSADLQPFETIPTPE